MELPTPHLPLPLRLLNRAGALLRSRGLRLGALEPDGLMDEAARAEGRSDFGDERELREALGVLCASIEEEPAIHTLARLHLRRLLLQALAIRLRLYAARRARPELARGPARPPLIVCGLPRSGTTFLHRLLAEAPDARPLPLWELMEPLPGRGPERRREEAVRRIERLNRLAPVSIDAQHLIRPDLPDECNHLLKCSLRSSFFWQAPLYRYLEWYRAQEMDGPYTEYRDLLVLLQDPARRLVLKDPFHCAHLPALLRALPGAMVVQTHRDPVETVPSFHKLTLTAHCVLADPVDPARMAEVNTRWLEGIAARTIAHRGALPEGRVLDVDYRALIADPVGTVARIHQHFGLDWTEALAARMNAFVVKNGQRKYGDNPYRAEAFGQDPAELARRFAEYRARFIPAR
jgi:hypothetical protein